MRISDWSSYVCSSDLDMPILLGHSMGGMTAAVVASKAAKATRGVVLVDPTFLSPQRQRDVCDSDVAEQHRRLLGQDEDRKSVVSGKSVSIRVDLGGGRIIKKNKHV